MKVSLRKIAFLAALDVLLSTPLCMRAQETSPSPIVVRGKVLSLQMESNESWRLKYNADVELRFINVSNHNVIIAKRDPVWMRSDCDHWYENGELTFRHTELDWGFRYSEINHPVPPADKFAVLAPGNAYIAHSKISLEFVRNKSDNASDEVYPKSLHAILKLFLNTGAPFLTPKEQEKMKAPNDQEMSDYFGKKWAAYGELIIGDIEAELIDIQLPPEPIPLTLPTD